MSKQSRARDKAFRAAAENMAKGQGYDMTLAPARLEQWIKDQVIQQDEEWQLIWDAARTWTEKKLELGIGSLEASIAARDEEIARLKLNLQTDPTERTWFTFQEAEVNRLKSNLAAVTETAKLRLAKIKALEQLVENRDRNIKVQAGIIERQRETARTLINENTGLRDERDALREDLKAQDAQDRELRLANLRIQNLNRRLNTAQAQLTEARALTTQGTTTVFEENERLVAELRRVEALNESLRAFNQDCMKERDQLIAAGSRVPLVPCSVTLGLHKCYNMTQPGKGHPQKHYCHCGTTWS